MVTGLFDLPFVANDLPRLFRSVLANISMGIKVPRWVVHVMGAVLLHQDLVFLHYQARKRRKYALESPPLPPARPKLDAPARTGLYGEGRSSRPLGSLGLAMQGHHVECEGASYARRLRGSRCHRISRTRSSRGSTYQQMRCDPLRGYRQVLEENHPLPAVGAWGTQRTACLYRA